LRLYQRIALGTVILRKRLRRIYLPREMPQPACGRSGMGLSSGLRYAYPELRLINDLSSVENELEQRAIYFLFDLVFALTDDVGLC
jgi:hypothetical protein